MASKWLKAAAIALPAALLFGACDTTMSIKLNEDRTAEVVMDINDTDGALTKLAGDRVKCDAFKEQLKTQAKDQETKVEDLSNGGNLHCKLSAKGPISASFKGEGFKETDTSYILDGSSLAGLKQSDLKQMKNLPFPLNIKLSIEMPGEIVKTEGDVKVSGNTATIEGVDALAKGFKVEGYKTASMASHIGLWIAIAVGAALIIAIATWLMLAAKKHKKNNVGTEAYQGPDTLMNGAPAPTSSVPPVPQAQPTGPTGVAPAPATPVMPTQNASAPIPGEIADATQTEISTPQAPEVDHGEKPGTVMDDGQGNDER
ncbi:hypothetical protein ACTOVJ_06765 [Arcanobacterium canis]